MRRRASCAQRDTDRRPLLVNHDLDWDIHLGDTDLSHLPQVRPWRSFALDPETRGPWVIAGDLNGDGVCELVIARARQVAPDQHATVSVAAVTLDGHELWRWGTPEQGTENLWHDIACQIHDWDGDGRNEVVVAADRAVVRLDGASGKELGRFPIPAEASDCITFADLRGTGRPADVIVKNRYRDLWAYTIDGELLWHLHMPGSYKTAHQPRPVDIDGKGTSGIMVGYVMVDGDAETLFSLADRGLDLGRGHLDCTRLLRQAPDPGDARLVHTLCGDDAIVCTDGAGRVIWKHLAEHFESLDVGELTDHHPGPQIAVDTTHGQAPFEDPLWFLDADGKPFGRVFGLRVRQHRNVRWLGNGLEQVLVVQDGVLIDADQGEPVLRLAVPEPAGMRPPNPSGREDEHKLFGDVLYKAFIADLDGDGIAEIVLSTNPATGVWIYKSDTAKPTTGLPLGTPLNYTLY
jgi:hypothetical protein